MSAYSWKENCCSSKADSLLSSSRETHTFQFYPSRLNTNPNSVVFRDKRQYKSVRSRQLVLFLCFSKFTLFRKQNKCYIVFHCWTLVTSIVLIFFFPSAHLLMMEIKLHNIAEFMIASLDSTKIVYPLRSHSRLTVRINTSREYICETVKSVSNFLSPPQSKLPTFRISRAVERVWE